MKKIYTIFSTVLAVFLTSAVVVYALSTKGGLVVGTGTSTGNYGYQEMLIGTDGKVLMVSSTAQYGLVWSAVGGTGTVTSVDMTTPTGLSISGNPITAAGTLALTLTAGYEIPTTASTSNWNSKVTSVGMTVPTGLSISGSPITTAGTLSLALTSGYEIPLTASTTSWNTVVGWERNTAVSGSDGTDKGISVSCSAGKKIIGGGAGTNIGTVNLTYNGPTSTVAASSTTWYAWANEEGTVSGNWTVTAFVFCAPVQ